MGRRFGLLCQGAAMSWFLVSAPVHAQSGTLELVLSTQSSTHAVDVGETTVTARGGSGTLTVVHSSAAPFTPGLSATVRYAGFSKKTPSGFALEAHGVATFGSGDMLSLLLKRESGDLSTGTSGEGTLEVTGESGRFAGVKGQCSYVVTNLPDNWNVAVARCSWSYSFPYR